MIFWNHGFFKQNTATEVLPQTPVVADRPWWSSPHHLQTQVGSVAYDPPEGKDFFSGNISGTNCQLDDYMLPIPPIKGTRKPKLIEWFFTLDDT